jgi:hypothetical protein
MEYTVNKIEDQQLMFHIKMKHNGKDIGFNVVCAVNDSEIPELVAFHLNALDNPPVIQAQTTPQINPSTLIQEQQAIIEELKSTSTSQQTKINDLEARLATLENI